MSLRQNNWTLGAYCQSYCGFVNGHHTLEDASVFPHLRRAEPDAAPVLDRLAGGARRHPPPARRRRPGRWSGSCRTPTRRRSTRWRRRCRPSATGCSATWPTRSASCAARWPGTASTDLAPRVARVTDPSTTVLLLLGLAGLAAGFVDAVVGGGGLIQLPALLLGLPRAPRRCRSWPPTSSSSICGTTVSSATYYRRIRPDPRTFGPLMALRVRRLGRRRGRRLAHLRRRAFDPIVLVVLVVVGGYVLFQPDARRDDRAAVRRPPPHRRPRWSTGLAIGFYDGALGPGTGSFFVITLVGLLGYSFLEASAKARLANWATNLAALCVFVPAGRGAVEGRPGDGRLQPGRRLRRRPDGGRARRRGSSGSSSSSWSRRSSSGSAATCSACGEPETRSARRAGTRD